MNEGAVFLTINHQNYPSVKLAGLGFLANRSYKGQRTLKMAGNGSSARLKISGVKNHKKCLEEDSPRDFHVGGCVSRPEKILYEESHLDEDGKGATKPDEEGAMGLIPNPEAHLFLKSV